MPKLLANITGARQLLLAWQEQFGTPCIPQLLGTVCVLDEKVHIFEVLRNYGSNSSDHKCYGVPDGRWLVVDIFKDASGEKLLTAICHPKITVNSWTRGDHLCFDSGILGIFNTKAIEILRKLHIKDGNEYLDLPEVDGRLCWFSTDVKEPEDYIDQIEHFSDLGLQLNSLNRGTSVITKSPQDAVVVHGKDKHGKIGMIVLDYQNFMKLGS